MTPLWIEQAFVYHIYPLGLCSAPKCNDFHSEPQSRLEMLYPWLDEIQFLGCNTLYLGPLFESSAHGYDTADYYHVDRRLGTRQTLAALVQEMHRRGMRIILDGVFNHVGRDFWAFRDLLSRGENSPYIHWFANLRFDERSPYGDPFRYEGWAGNYDLVKLNLANPDVRQHLFGAVQMWIEELGIDGLRLDAADELSLDFIESLSQFCRALRPDFWLMGEMVHGDYRRLAAPQRLDATTNYEAYKGLYSSLNDRNYFEIAYTLQRQFGAQGVYQGLQLYNFVDNHDVNRVASNLLDAAHLCPLYTLLMTMPGVPSIYYGSEWGILGQRTAFSDEALRPALRLEDAASAPNPKLGEWIAQLAEVRRQSSALQCGNYAQIHVAAEQFAFLRQSEAQTVLVALNSASSAVDLTLRLPFAEGWLADLLCPGEGIAIHHGEAKLEHLPAYGSRILALARDF